MARREITGRKSGASTVKKSQPQDIEPDEPDEPDESEADDQHEPPPPPAPRLAYSIKEFCKAHSISEDFYYKLKRQKKQPKEMQVGSRVLISHEAARDWRREQEGTRNTVAA
jgi:hypothetical protein